MGVGLLDGEDRVREFVQRHRLSFPNVYDAGGSLARAYGFSRQPFYALVDRQERLVQRGFGPTDVGRFAQQVEELLR